MDREKDTERNMHTDKGKERETSRVKVTEKVNGRNTDKTR